MQISCYKGYIEIYDILGVFRKKKVFETLKKLKIPTFSLFTIK